MLPYLGLILVVVALNIQWPTILTLLMAWAYRRSGRPAA
jgi:hypothetical protein